MFPQSFTNEHAAMAVTRLGHESEEIGQCPTTWAVGVSEVEMACQ